MLAGIGGSGSEVDREARKRREGLSTFYASPGACPEVLGNSAGSRVCALPCPRASSESLASSQDGKMAIAPPMIR